MKGIVPTPCLNRRATETIRCRPSRADDQPSALVGLPVRGAMAPPLAPCYHVMHRPRRLCRSLDLRGRPEGGRPGASRRSCHDGLAIDPRCSKGRRGSAHRARCGAVPPYRRTARTANRHFLRGILPAVALVVAAALVAGSELSLAALSCLGFPGVLLVTRLIELVALWIAPDGRPQLSAQTSEAAGAGAPHRSR